MALPPTPRVFVDACVFWSRTLRDWLGMLYTEVGYPLEVLWTEDIMAEVLHSLRRQHPPWDGRRISEVHDRLTEIFSHGRVNEYETAGYLGSDPMDAHVHGAAVACRADYLLTLNVRDFADADDVSYEVMHPDHFLVLVDDSVPGLVYAVALAMVRYWLERGKSPDLPRRLRECECPQFAERVRRHLQEIPLEMLRLDP